jgi:hypothetical protein
MKPNFCFMAMPCLLSWREDERVRGYEGENSLRLGVFAVNLDCGLVSLCSV